MIVLGIDPGIAITGCALVREDKSNLTLLEAQSITTSSKLSHSKRLLKLYKHLNDIIKSLKPDIAALENLFFSSNAKTAFLVGQARGVIQLSLIQNHIPVVEYTPLQVKMAITGYGRADKKQIQMMVKQILKLPKVLSPDDVADAAAIALTHCFSYKMKLKRLAPSV